MNLIAYMFIMNTDQIKDYLTYHEGDFDEFDNVLKTYLSGKITTFNIEILYLFVYLFGSPNLNYVKFEWDFSLIFELLKSHYEGKEIELFKKCLHIDNDSCNKFLIKHFDFIINNFDELDLASNLPKPNPALIIKILNSDLRDDQKEDYLDELRYSEHINDVRPLFDILENNKCYSESLFIYIFTHCDEKLDISKYYSKIKISNEQTFGEYFPYLFKHEFIRKKLLIMFTIDYGHIVLNNSEHYIVAIYNSLNKGKLTSKVTNFVRKNPGILCNYL